VPVFVTEQNPRALGSTVQELDLANLGDLHVSRLPNAAIPWTDPSPCVSNIESQIGTFPKTKFSMFIPEVEEKLHVHRIQTVVLFGIEVHSMWLTFYISYQFILEPCMRDADGT
jgi:hypothetical protein